MSNAEINYETKSQRNEYAHSILHPWLPTTSGIPDNTVVQSTIKTANMSQNTQGVSTLVVQYSPFRAKDRVIIAKMVTDPATGMQVPGWIKAVPEDATLDSTYSQARLVSGGLRIWCSTVSTTNSNLQGQYSAAVLYDRVPREEMGPSRITGYNGAKAIANSSLFSELIMLAIPLDLPKYFSLGGLTQNPMGPATVLSIRETSLAPKFFTGANLHTGTPLPGGVNGGLPGGTVMEIDPDATDLVGLDGMFSISCNWSKTLNLARLDDTKTPDVSLFTAGLIEAVYLDSDGKEAPCEFLGTEDDSLVQLTSRYSLFGPSNFQPFTVSKKALFYSPFPVYRLRFKVFTTAAVSLADTVTNAGTALWTGNCVVTAFDYGNLPKEFPMMIMSASGIDTNANVSLQGRHTYEVIPNARLARDLPLVPKKVVDITDLQYALRFCGKLPPLLTASDYVHIANMSTSREFVATAGFWDDLWGGIKKVGSFVGDVVKPALPIIYQGVGKKLGLMSQYMQQEDGLDPNLLGYATAGPSDVWQASTWTGPLEVLRRRARPTLGVRPTVWPLPALEPFPGPPEMGPEPFFDEEEGGASVFDYRGEWEENRRKHEKELKKAVRTYMRLRDDGKAPPGLVEKAERRVERAQGKLRWYANPAEAVRRHWGAFNWAQMAVPRAVRRYWTLRELDDTQFLEEAKACPSSEIGFASSWDGSSSSSSSSGQGNARPPPGNLLDSLGGEKLNRMSGSSWIPLKMVESHYSAQNAGSFMPPDNKEWQTKLRVIAFPMVQKWDTGFRTSRIALCLSRMVISHNGASTGYSQSLSAPGLFFCKNLVMGMDRQLQTDQAGGFKIKSFLDKVTAIITSSSLIVNEDAKLYVTICNPFIDVEVDSRGVPNLLKLFPLVAGDSFLAALWCAVAGLITRFIITGSVTLVDGVPTSFAKMGDLGPKVMGLDRSENTLVIPNDPDIIALLRQTGVAGISTTSVMSGKDTPKGSVVLASTPAELLALQSIITSREGKKAAGPSLEIPKGYVSVKGSRVPQKIVHPPVPERQTVTFNYRKHGSSESKQMTREVTLSDLVSQAKLDIGRLPGTHEGEATKKILRHFVSAAESKTGVDPKIVSGLAAKTALEAQQREDSTGGKKKAKVRTEIDYSAFFSDGAEPTFLPEHGAGDDYV